MSTDQVPHVAAGITFTPPSVGSAPIELHNGDRMNREEFHRLYEKTPEGFKAELVGGIVYVASPLSRFHGRPHVHLGMLLGLYEGKTDGIECSDNTTVFLGEEGEPQPDLYLRILPDYGGQSKTTDDGNYVDGAPEFVAEVANSSRAIDLHGKKNDYTRYGVREYLVVNIKDQSLHFFDLANKTEIAADKEGVFRSQVFPGLWINGPALLEKKHAAMIETLEVGLATDEHAEFVKTLAGRKDKAQKK